MIFRINMKHFLLEAIDHFSLEDLIGADYYIISAGIPNGGRSNHITKFNELYPSTEMQYDYATTGDYKVFKKRYYGMLDSDDDNRDKTSNSYHNLIYRGLINPLLQSMNIFMICKEEEDYILDALCSYLKDRFDIEVVDLNELFSKGRVGAIYLDRDKIRDKAVDIRRNALKAEFKSMKETRGGRENLLKKMSRKDKERDQTTLMVVASPKDVMSFELSDGYHGLYHVLGGTISISKGMDVEKLSIPSLLERIEKGNIKEVIIATNPTIDGETTALYISKLLEKYDVNVTRLAYGLPMGGNLEYADALTLAKAIEGRRKI